MNLICCTDLQILLSPHSRFHAFYLSREQVITEDSEGI